VVSTTYLCQVLEFAVVDDHDRAVRLARATTVRPRQDSALRNSAHLSPSGGTNDEGRTVDLSKFTHAHPLQIVHAGSVSATEPPYAKVIMPARRLEGLATRVMDEQRGVGHVEIRVRRVAQQDASLYTILAFETRRRDTKVIFDNSLNS
jgi:hypothetical protein